MLKLWYNYGKNDPFVEMVSNFLNEEIKSSNVLSDVSSDENGYTIKMVLPGVEKKDLNVSVKGDSLHISYDKNDGEYITPFTKKYKLSDECDKKNITSQLLNGILVIKVPKIKTKIYEKQIEID